jgi:4-hydroxy-tetrahydrodipicolinate synthase
VVNDRIVPLAQVFHAPPLLDLHNRMKEALVLPGRMDRAVVRPPRVKPCDAEITRLLEAIARSGIGQSARGRAA